MKDFFILTLGLSLTKQNSFSMSKKKLSHRSYKIVAKEILRMAETQTHSEDYLLIKIAKLIAETQTKNSNLIKYQ